MEQDSGNIIIYQSSDGRAEIDIRLENETLWMSQKQIAELFDVNTPAINKHITNIFTTGELNPDPTVSKMEIVQKEGKRTVKRTIDLYNLDMVIAVGYRVNSKKATAFRVWATDVLKKYLMNGYALNEKRLQERVASFNNLKKTVNLLERALKNQITDVKQAKKLAEVLANFANGLDLLDDYDNKKLDKSGKTKKKAQEIKLSEFLKVVQDMRPKFTTSLFGVPKDDSFESSVQQIYQGVDGSDLYPSIEEKAATLLYLVTKNHSFLDGNKRIAAACFLYFLNENGLLYGEGDEKLIDDETLFALTILIAESRSSEMNVMKQIIVSILNRKGKR